MSCTSFLCTQLLYSLLKQKKITIGIDLYKNNKHNCMGKHF
jgi:hypothetical protein